VATWAGPLSGLDGDSEKVGDPRRHRSVPNSRRSEVADRPAWQASAKFCQKTDGAPCGRPTRAGSPYRPDRVSPSSTPQNAYEWPLV
jgi:hypothetical protein